MDWESINGITGIISAICAIASLGYFGSHKKVTNSEPNKNILKLQNFMAFLLACSGWSLCCISYTWVFEPFGGIITEKEYKQLFGIILAFPAVVIFWFAIKVLGFVKT